jgi:hypothetical protein
MLTSSGAHNFKSSRSARVTATARQITGIRHLTVLPSLTTNIGSGPNLVASGPTTDYEPRPSSAPDIPPSASFAAFAEVSPEVAVLTPSHGPESVPVLSGDDPLQGLIALINHLSEQVHYSRRRLRHSRPKRPHLKKELKD